jgi:hypothetical protein
MNPTIEMIEARKRAPSRRGECSPRRRLGLASCVVLALAWLGAGGCADPGTLLQADVGSSPTSRTGPILRIEDRVFDWGKTQAGQDLRHTFVLHNDGDEALQIRWAKSSCGCCASSFDSEILPGGEGRLEVLIHGTALRPGKAKARIELRCNDPRAPFFVLTGDVGPPQ